MPQFIFGEGYGDIGNRELATQAAANQRYQFSVGALQRADEMSAQDEQNWQRSRQIDEQQRANWFQMLHRNQQDNDTLDWHRGNLANENSKLALDRSKFDFMQRQPTAAQINDARRREEADKEHEALYDEASAYANLLKKRDYVKLQASKVPGADQLGAQYKAEPWTWTGPTYKNKVRQRNTENFMGLLPEDMTTEQIAALPYEKRAAMAAAEATSQLRDLNDRIKLVSPDVQSLVVPDENMRWRINLPPPLSRQGKFTQATPPPPQSMPAPAAPAIVSPKVRMANALRERYPNWSREQIIAEVNSQMP